MRNPKNTVAYFRDFVGKELVASWHNQLLIDPVLTRIRIDSKPLIQAHAMLLLIPKSMALRLIFRYKIPKPKHPTTSPFLKSSHDI